MTRDERLEDLFTRARQLRATVVESAGAVVIVVATDASSDDLVPLAAAAALAATSERTLRDAIRAGEIVAFGKQRDRSVRRADLMTWIDSRRVRIEIGRDDDAIDKRARRIEKRRKAS